MAKEANGIKKFKLGKFVKKDLKQLKCKLLWVIKELRT